MLIITNVKAYVVNKEEIERKIKLTYITGVTHDGGKEILIYVRDQYDFRFRVSSNSDHEHLIQAFTKLIALFKAHKPLRG